MYYKIELTCAQAYGECQGMTDGITGQCASYCLDQTQCSSPSRPCPYHPIRVNADFLYYNNCTELCDLHLDDLPLYSPWEYRVFTGVTKIRGVLTVTNNEFLYTIDFLSNLTSVS